MPPRFIVNARNLEHHCRLLRLQSPQREYVQGESYLLRLVYDLNDSLALLVNAAVQDASSLDSEGQSAADVGLEGIGCVPVKGH